MLNNVSSKPYGENSGSGSGTGAVVSSVPMNSGTNWSISNIGTGVGSLNLAGQFFNVDIPTGAVNPSGSSAVYDLSASLVTDFTLRTIEVVGRIKSVSGVNASSRIELFLAGDTGAAPVVILSVWGDGSVETGWTNTAGLFTSFGWSGAGTVPLDGTGWIRLSISGSVASYYWAAGASQPKKWRILQSRPLTCAINGENPITTLIVGGLHLAVPGTDINIQMSDVSVITV